MSHNKSITKNFKLDKDFLMQLTTKLIDMIGDNSKIISITGSGGKTTLLTLLSSAYREMGKSVLITTTTKIQSPKLYSFNQDAYFLDEKDMLLHEVKKGEVVFFAERHIMDPKKCIAPRLEVLNALLPKFDVVIIEADGAKGLPLKLHTERDPVIIKQTTTTIAVMGSSALGLKGDNVCFGYESEKMVDKDFFQMLIDDEYGALKDMAGNCKILLINQCDENDYSVLKELSIPSEVTLLFGSENEDKIYE